MKHLLPVPLTVGLLLLGVLSGCMPSSSNPLLVVQGPAALASTARLGQPQRWRLPRQSPVRVISLNAAKDSRWAAASLAGLQQGFPQASAGDAPISGSGLTLYLQWPALAAAADPQASWVGLLPKRLGIGRAPRIDSVVGLVCVDNHSRQVLHQGQLRIRERWLLTSAGQWHPDLQRAFARYAKRLASG